MTALDRARDLLAADDEPTRLRGVHLLRDDVCDAEAAALLAATLADPGSYVPHAARAALSDLGTVAHAALFAVLGSEDPGLRCHSLWALAVPQGAAADRVLEHVVPLATDPGRDVRHAVAGVLGRLDADVGSVGAVLSDLAADHEHRVREEVAESLGLRTELALAFRPVLLALLDDGHGGVRGAAARSLAALPPDAAGLLLARELLADEIHEPTRVALAALLERWEVP